MILEPGKTYDVKFKFKDGDRVQTLHIQELYRHSYMQGGSLVGADFGLVTPTRACYLIPEQNVAMYQKAHSGSDILDWIVLEDPNCGILSFMTGTPSCEHKWAETCLSWTYCTVCDKEGWNQMGVISEKK